ncbi:MAG: ABC transporter ATP-binding protein [Firmicutes bacterium]|jgi:iron complex transport system ATP-binding protein|nr:ABC transporter ATP-binding protein [Bacillota bacterium]MDH7496688.1 ABC transporter ATP-binding protein [Bacillota bacterium]
MRLEVFSVSCVYGIITALDQVSVSVCGGEFVGVLGPNGSGKTTLIRAMAGALRPSRGRVTLDGRDIHTMSAKAVARQLAVVPQDGYTPFSFSVRDIVLMGRWAHLGRFSGVTAGDVEAAVRAMEATRVAHLAGRPITQLSYGERQRVMVARALAQEPRILLLDEPTSHLDPRHQVEVMDLVWGLSRREGLGVAAVLHDVNLAAQYCDRIVMLKDGRLVASGTPREVVAARVIEEVYGVPCCVTSHPVNGRPQVLLASQLAPSEPV